MTHKEQQTFTITLHLSAEFADDYAGDEDGFVWHARFLDGVRPALLAGVQDALRGQPRFRAVSAPRGRDPEGAVDFDVHFETTPNG